jgi:hypothetical protein
VACSGGADVVMVPSDEDSAPPPPVGDRDVAMTLASEPSPAAGVSEPSPAAGAPEPSSAVGAASIEEVMDLATCRYVDFLGIGIVDLDTSELPSNDRKMLEVACDAPRVVTWRQSGCSPSRRSWKPLRRLRWRYVSTRVLAARRPLPRRAHTITDQGGPGGVPAPASRGSCIHNYCHNDQRGGGSFRRGGAFVAPSGRCHLR